VTVTNGSLALADAATQPFGQPNVAATLSYTQVATPSGYRRLLGDPCVVFPKVPFLIGQATSSQVIPGSAGLTVAICDFDVVTTGNALLTLVEGTGTTCGTARQNLSGGWPFLAGGGLVKGNGAAQVFTARVAGDSVCLLQSVTTHVGGDGHYVLVQ
jgi:hypothetical protein